MEKTRFIFRFIIAIFLKSLLMALIVMYFLAYLKIIVFNSIEKKVFYNPFTTEVVETSETTKNDDNDEKMTEIVGFNYFVIVKMNGVERNVKISKEQFAEFQNEKYITSNGETFKVEYFDKIPIEKEKEKKQNPQKNEEIKKTYELTPQKQQENYFGLISYVFTDIYLIIIFLIALTYLMSLKLKYYKFYLLPYELNVFENFGTEQQTSKMYRYFIGKKGDRYYYRNKAKSPFDKFLRQEREILDKLDWDTLEITRTEKNTIKIRKMSLPDRVAFDSSKLKKGFLYAGISKGYQDLYFEIEKFSHSIIIGGSGSGKSVFLQNLIVSFFYNIEMFERFVFIDFKRVELRRYKEKEKVQYINNIDDYCNTIAELRQIMTERLIENEEKGYTTSKKPFILVAIDEFATIKNSGMDSKKEKEVDSHLIILLQQSRARNIRFIFAGQTCKVTDINSRVIANILTRILLGTEDNDNITKMLGNAEVLKRNGLSKEMITKWKRGKGVFKDNEKAGSFIFQSPFLDVESEEHWNFVCSLIKDKKEIKTDEVKEEKENFVLDYKPLNFEILQEEKNLNVEILEPQKIQNNTEIFLPQENNLNRNEIERILMNYWKQTEQIENETTKSQIRKKIQSRKRNYKNQELDLLNTELITLKTFFGKL